MLKMNSIEELNKLINQSIEISRVNVDNGYTWEGYIKEILSNYPLVHHELADIRKCYDTCMTTNQAISRLSDIRLGYI